MIETKTKMINTDVSNNLINVIILDAGGKNILEKPMIDYVKDSVSMFSTKIIKYNPKKPELKNIKKHLTDSLYTLVLYSFNPLLTEKNIKLIVDYAVLRSERFVKLPFGSIFLTHYVKDNDKIDTSVAFSGDSSEFIKVVSDDEIGYASEVIKHRLISTFIHNGVKFIDPNNTIVNAYVEIESGVTIFPFNTLKGKSIIHKGVILKEHNTINHCSIGAESVIANSVITNTVIKENCLVFPFNEISNSYVGKNCTIKSNNKIDNSKIGDNTTVDSFNQLG